MREPAPPYVGEGPHALWHVSENAAIARFEPHVSATAASGEPRVWAVDSRHLPLYWFPRECPRGAFWATSHTTRQDAEILGDASRVHVVETGWLERMRSARVVAYRLPEATFAPDGDVGGYWPAELPSSPWASWSSVTSSHDTRPPGSRCARCRTSGRSGVASSLEFSGIRLHNALPPSDG